MFTPTHAKHGFLEGLYMKTQLVAVATSLHARGVLAPCAVFATRLWRGSGRALVFAKVAFWLNLLSERYDMSRNIVSFHALPDRSTRHRDWAAGVRNVLENRSPINLDDLRAAFAPRQPIGSKPDADRMIYVLSGSLPQMRSGYAYRAHGLMGGLSELGVKVTAVTRPGFPADMAHLAGMAEASAIQCDVDDLRYHRIRSPLRTEQSALSYINSASHVLTEFMAGQKTAAVMAASNHMTALPALIAARRLGLPFIYEVRGFWEITQASRDPAFARSLRYENAVALESLAAQEADRVVTLNQPMADELVRRGVARDKIVLLPNACDPDKYAPRARDTDLARQLRLDPQTPVIGFVGSFTAYEGLDDLLLACGVLRRRGIEFKLVLVGDEVIYNALQKPLMPRLRRLVVQEKLEKYVHFAGRVPSVDVPRWYSLIDIAPFARKPFAVSELVPPLKPVEAMAMCKAVIASDVGALRDFIMDGQTGLIFPKGDIGAFADMLERVLRDGVLRHALGVRARDWVIEERSWRHVAQNLQGLLHELSN